VDVDRDCEASTRYLVTAPTRPRGYTERRNMEFENKYNLSPESTQDEIIKAWVDDLRVNVAKQAIGRLWRKDSGIDSFCCLGRLCVLAIAAKVIPEPSKHVKYDGSAVMQIEEQLAFLPLKVREWIGMNNNEGQFVTRYTLALPSSLTSLNDSGKSFNEIADVIESRPKNLFLTKLTESPSE
jgi:hypothetical protein